LWELAYSRNRRMRMGHIRLFTAFAYSQVREVYPNQAPYLATEEPESKLVPVFPWCQKNLVQYTPVFPGVIYSFSSVIAENNMPLTMAEIERVDVATCCL